MTLAKFIKRSADDQRAQKNESAKMVPQAVRHVDLLMREKMAASEAEPTYPSKLEQPEIGHQEGQ